MAGSSEEANSEKWAIGAVTITFALMACEYMYYFVPRPEGSVFVHLAYLQSIFPDFGNFNRGVYVLMTFLALRTIEKGAMFKGFFESHILLKIVAVLLTLVFGYLLIYVFLLPKDLVRGMYPILGIGYFFLCFIATSSSSSKSVLVKNKFGFKRARKFETEHSFNLHSKEDGWLNIINPFRSTLVVGNPGSGKSWFFLKRFLEIVVKKGFSGLIYDFKAPELIKFVIDHFWNYKSKMAVKDENGKWIGEHSIHNDRRRIWVIDFSDLSRSHRVNPVHPDYMKSSIDANEMAMTVLFNLNPSWIEKRDFWADSAIIYFQSILWYLRVHFPEACTLPHAISIALMPYDKVIAALRTDEECEKIMEPIAVAMRNKAEGQLSGQIAALQTPIARLNSPELSYILSENDFSLNLNDPENPGLLLLGNNPQRSESYGPILSLISSLTMKSLNRKHRLHSVCFFDEAPTLFIPKFDQGPATSRSNKVAYFYSCQSTSQIASMYGDKLSKNIIGTLGTQIFCQVSNMDDAANASKMIGKMDKETKSMSFDKSGKKSGTNLNVAKTNLMDDEEIRIMEPGRAVGVLAETQGKFSAIFNIKPDVKILEEGHAFNPFVGWQTDKGVIYPSHDELLQLAIKKHRFITDQARLLIEEGAMQAIAMGKGTEEKIFPEHFRQEGNTQVRVKTKYGDHIDENGFYISRETGEILGSNDTGYYPDFNTETAA